MFPPTRRRFLSSCLGGVSAWAFGAHFQSALAAADAHGSAKACILIFLEGGPSHVDTFDPKPGAASSGPFAAIDTKIPGVQFAEHLPRLAQSADKLAVVRSLHSREGDHERAAVLLHTGYIPNPALSYPSLGSTVAAQRVSEDAPGYVSFYGSFGPGFLGAEHGPFRIDNLDEPARDLALPEGFEEDRLVRRLAALTAFNSGFAQQTGTAIPEDFTRLSRRADRLRHSPSLQPQDFSNEKPELLEAYGLNTDDPTLARMCLMARRMVENGVRFVEIQFGGWDTHEDNFNQVQSLSARLDAALATLLSDLADRGLLETTLVACFGEFGRTPTINGSNGRDHWSDAFSAVLAGGGVRGGRVVGASDPKGEQVADRPVRVQDLHATIFQSLGLDPAAKHPTPDGRLVKLTDDGQAIQELFA